MSIAVIDKEVEASRLSGKMLKEGIISAAHHLGSHKGEVDALNVFPVPDGDTGTNMSMTMEAAARELTNLSDDTAFDAAAESLAAAMLRGARGNSGVILSLIFRGFAKSVAGLEHIGGEDLANALIQGSEMAYKAVMKPTEGTILTVIREAGEKATETANLTKDDAVAVWTGALCGAKEALLRTPSLLPVLEEAGVVDAGGQGLVYVMEGLLQGFLGQSHEDEPLPVPQANAIRRFLTELGVNDDHADIKFGYCTECLIGRGEEYQQDTQKLRKKLEQLGDCVVLVDDEEIIKLHVHTNQPDEVLKNALRYGQLLETKVENMRAQSKALQNESAEEAAQAESPGAPAVPVAPAVPKKPYGIVAVANGEGIHELFAELGTDAMVKGGQSMNPSTEDILQAVEQVNAEHVFVLPNNKNIIMAAEQAVPLASKGVTVVHTRSIVEGIGAVLDFDPCLDAQENCAQMQDAAGRVQTGLVTYAARGTVVNGMDIQKDAMIGLENGNLTLTEREPVAAAYRVIKRLVRAHSGTMVTVYPGEDVTQEQTDRLMELLERHYKGRVEISAVPGGQPMYYYMISVE